MIKRLISYFSLIVIVFTLSACTGTNQASDLKFYVVNRSLLNDGMSDSQVIKTAKAEGRLVFDGEDIYGYNWQNHLITLSKDSVFSIGTTTKESGGSAIFKVDDSYAFVLVLKNKLIYTGGFVSGTKNPNVPLQPYIKDESKYSFSIKFDSKYADFEDNRQNSALYDFLKHQGLLSSKTN